MDKEIRYLLHFIDIFSKHHYSFKREKTYKQMTSI